MRALIGRAASAASRRICTGQSHSLLSASIISSNTPRLSRQLSTAFPVSNKGIWGQNTEGDNFSVNWSLTEDGVVPTGDAYRNARVPLLTTRLPAKVSNGKVEVSKPAYSGSFKLLEAGDSITQEAFGAALSSQCNGLSSGKEMFVEDAALGASHTVRVGVRVVTNCAATALIVRSLLIPVPKRDEVDHRARFDGWNLDERWHETNYEWKGDRYEESKSWATPLMGSRPVGAFVGEGSSKDTPLAVQFVDNPQLKRIVGANVIASESSPVRGIIDALGLAATVVMNARSADTIALPSCTLTKDKKTVVVVNASDSVVEKAASANSLYGAYHNAITTQGVSALWNGIIAKAPQTNASDVPHVVNGGLAAVSMPPNNMAFAPEVFVFYEEGASKANLSEEDAVKRIVALTDDSKSALAATLVKGKKCLLVGSAADAIATL